MSCPAPVWASRDRSRPSSSAMPLRSSSSKSSSSDPYDHSCSSSSRSRPEIRAFRRSPSCWISSSSMGLLCDTSSSLMVVARTLRALNDLVKSPSSRSKYSMHGSGASPGRPRDSIRSEASITHASSVTRSSRLKPKCSPPTITDIVEWKLASDTSLAVTDARRWPPSSAASLNVSSMLPKRPPGGSILLLPHRGADRQGPWGDAVCPGTNAPPQKCLSSSPRSLPVIRGELRGGDGPSGGRGKWGRRKPARGSSSRSQGPTEWKNPTPMPRFAASRCLVPVSGAQAGPPTRVRRALPPPTTEEMQDKPSQRSKLKRARL
mmetsp:Transcript_13336/g.32160  ORF Transcript_13336/g.32160 Transcript_13336/m.32160 type:complete len:320 (-) Transcript_13336:15-974(-)